MLTKIKTLIGRIKRLSGRVLATAVLTTVLAIVSLGVMASTKTVTVYENGRQWKIFTLADNLESILTQTGSTITVRDQVEFTGFSGNTATLRIHHPVSVNVIDAGSTITYVAVNQTVRDVLMGAGVDLRDEDLINIPLSEKVTGEDIVITRKDEKDVTEVTAIPYGVTYKKTPIIKAGKTYELSPGSDGKMVTTYHEVYTDGMLTSRTIVEQYVSAPAVNQLVLLGVDDNIPVSEIPLPSYLKFDANGVPTSYQRVISNVKSSAYSAKPGTLTASGPKAVVGTVAVDPREIPFGSELYIMTVDGSALYGYAVATDSGIALWNNTVEADLFFGSYLESCKWGIRMVNIYVLR